MLASRRRSTRFALVPALVMAGALGVASSSRAQQGSTADDPPEQGAAGASEVDEAADEQSEEAAAEQSEEAEPAAGDETLANADPHADRAARRGPEPPKVVVVIAGDPDPSLRQAAHGLERTLRESRFRFPVDDGLRAALRGAPPGPDDDGLSGVRRARRQLGLSEAEDAPHLTSIGRRAGAVCVVVVRAGVGGPHAVVFDPARSAFFDGELSLDDADTTEVRRFVGTRARAAARARLSPEAVANASLESQSPTAPGADLSEPGSGGEEGEVDGVLAFFESNWPYFAIGAALAAMLIVIAVSGAGNDAPPPVLRFRPGGR